jgi:hypothetical protein
LRITQAAIVIRAKNALRLPAQAGLSHTTKQVPGWGGLCASSMIFVDTNRTVMFFNFLINLLLWFFIIRGPFCVRHVYKFHSVLEFAIFFTITITIVASTCHSVADQATNSLAQAMSISLDGPGIGDDILLLLVNVNCLCSQPNSKPDPVPSVASARFTSKPQ